MNKSLNVSLSTNMIIIIIIIIIIILGTLVNSLNTLKIEHETKSFIDRVKRSSQLSNDSHSKTMSSEVSLEANEASEIEPFIFMSIVYILSTSTAIFTNLIVILVYFFGKQAKTDLSLFLVNLAIADFLMSTFCIPFTVAQVLLKRWIFGEVMCPIGCLFFSFLFISINF
jgi:hypothetical protein